MKIRFLSQEENELLSKNEPVNNLDFIKQFVNNKTTKRIKYDDFLTLSTTKFRSKISEILCKYLSKYISISNNCLYIYSKELKIHYKTNYLIDCDELLSNYIITFCEASYEKLEPSQQNLIYKPFLGNIGKTNLNLIKTNLRVSDEIFNNPKIGEIHFKDGYIDLKNLEFRERKRTDYMTFCIFRNFKPENGTEKLYKDAKTKLLKIINQIYPDENDKNCVLESFSEALIGISSKSQYNLFLLGMGSSGKSTLMKIIKNAFGEMIFQFKDDTFAKNNQKSDRVLNMLMLNPYIRIMWVNELKGKIDDSLFKQICEGEIQTTTLFKEGMNTVKFNALLVNTMNEFPNIKIDSGVERRIRSLEHKSKFTTDKKIVDDTKHIYYANADLIDEIANDEIFLNVFVELIAEYAHKFLKGEKYELSNNFKETKINIIDTNDTIKQFIDEEFIKTEDPKDKMNLEDIYNHFKVKYPQSRITYQQFISSKEKFISKGYEYKPDIRFKNKRGGFIYIKTNDDIDDDVEEESPLDYKFGKIAKSNDYENENIKLKNEILTLKQQLEEYKQKMETMVLKPVIEEVKEVKEEIIEEETKKSTKSKRNKANQKQFTEEAIKNIVDLI